MPTPKPEATAAVAKLTSQTTKAAKRLAAKLEKHRAVIARERDALCAVVSDYEDLLGDLDEAHAGLECAIDALSRLQ